MSNLYRPFGGPRRTFTKAEFVLMEGRTSRVLLLRHPTGELPTKLENRETGHTYLPTGMRDALMRPIYRMEEPNGQEAQDAEGNREAGAQDRAEDRAQRE